MFSTYLNKLLGKMLDVSTTGSIGTSMTFQDNEIMCSSMITSRDFSNISYFLINDDDCKDHLMNKDLESMGGITVPSHWPEFEWNFQQYEQDCHKHFK